MEEGEENTQNLLAAWVSQKAKLFLVKTTKLAQAFICIFSAIGQRHPAQIPGKDLPTSLLQFSSKIDLAECRQHARGFITLFVKFLSLLVAVCQVN